MTKSSTSSPPQSTAPTTPPIASASLMARFYCFQTSVDALLKHVRYLEHGVKMALSTPALQEEFASDKIFFGLSSDDDDGGSGDKASGAVNSVSDASTERVSDSDASTESVSDSDALPENASASDHLAGSASASSGSDGDRPLLHHLKKSKTVP